MGTSYAAVGQGKPTILPLAEYYSLQEIVTEVTDRIPFYTGLQLLQAADILLVAGSDDPQYTASKLYPYLQTGRPIIAILHRESSGVKILRECLPHEPVFTFPGNKERTIRDIKQYLEFIIQHPGYQPFLNQSAFEPYTAKQMAKKQTELFNEVIADE
jgi:hypothetical protein